MMTQTGESAGLPGSGATAGAQAFLIFQVGPVQEFIGQARKVRDLWSGSYLISYLSAQAMLAVDRELGSKAIIFPNLDEAPLAQFSRGKQPAAAALRTPCLPNRFLALVPAERAEEIARLARAAVRKEWQAIHESVRTEIRKIVGPPPGWDEAWDAQVARFPQIDSVTHLWGDAAAARKLALSQHAVPPLPAATLDAAIRVISDDAPESAWALHYAAADWKLAAVKNARGFDSWRQRAHALAMAQKDHLDGRNEVLGGSAYVEFWEELAKKRPNDFKPKQRYGALTVIKRLWDKTWLRSKLGLDAREWFPDTGWIAQLDKRADAEGEDAQRYYAMIMMDGDDLGQWLSGGKSDGPVSADFHRHLSSALAAFALGKARQVVEECGGYLIYSGGDDAFAMVPASRALECASALAAAFRAVLPGAGASAGIAVGHIHVPMQDVIQAARDAERSAKGRKGKNAFTLSILKRSGEAVSFTAPWTGGVISVWHELTCRGDEFSHALAHDYGARMKELLIEGGSATGARYAENWTTELATIAEAELRHVLRRQGKLDNDAAQKQASAWCRSLIGEQGAAVLVPRDFLHFWLAWAFIRRLPSERVDATTLQ